MNRAISFIVICVIAALTLPVCALDTPFGVGQTVVARVSTGSITLDQILEQFGPAWYEITGRAKSGTLAPSQVDAQLQKAWESALESALKDEVFYQEAMRSFEQKFQKYVDSYMAGNRGGAGARREVERRLKALMERNRNAQIQRMIEHNINKAGGFESLARMLKSRGLTFEDWKQRIVRKAYTYNFLFTVFEPMGKSVQPSPSKVLRYYRANRDKFTLPGRVIFRHIYTDNNKHGGEQQAYGVASEVYEKLATGKMTFDEAVKTYSEDQISAARGGLERGESTDPEREAWLAEVRQAASEQQPGKLGPVLISPRGCHIAILERAFPGELIPFKKAQKMILDQMENEKWQKRSDEYYQQLRKVMHINIMQPNFPQKYSWTNLGSQNVPRRIGFTTSDYNNK